MKIKDLVNLVTFDFFYETCKMKLNNTLVKYKDEWCYCSISDGPQYGSDDGPKMYQYGTGAKWIHLAGLPSRGKREPLRLNSLAYVDTEPTWPDMGYYYWNKTAWLLTYPNTTIYKAGLAPQQIELAPLNNRVAHRHHGDLADFLNPLLKGELKYPTLIRATTLLRTTANYAIPITRHALLEAHPFVEHPVITYGKVPVGVVKQGRLRLSPSNKNLEEYFNHVGVPIA